jgi:phosphoserine aminotransferase
MHNTPSTFSWYAAGRVFEWLKEQGGIKAIAETNERKANKLYQAIDSSDFYSNSVNPKYRSWMNVPFILADDSLDKLFLEKSYNANLLALKGHKSVGGMRASIYNAMPESGIDTLIEFMADFEKQYG